jgi:surface protein
MSEMNSDIIYEILRFLHLAPEENGGTLLAKKLVLSFRKRRHLMKRERKLDKPIVFNIKDDRIKFCTELFTDTVVYFSQIGNGSKCFGNNIRKQKTSVKFLEHIYDKLDFYVIKIFGHRDSFIMPYNVINVYSIGNMLSLCKMFTICNKINQNIGKNWDTSAVTDMSYMFRGCSYLNQNIGKKWNTSKVTDMSCMFAFCTILNFNVGKNWDVSKVKNMDEMFWYCLRLDKNVGKNWDTSQVMNMAAMFSNCGSLNKNIGKKWNTLNVTNMSAMLMNVLI